MNYSGAIECLDGYIAIAADASVIAGTRDTQGSPVPGTTCVDGADTITKTGTGEYTVTLSKSYRRRRSLVPGLVFAAAAPAAFDVVLKQDNNTYATAGGAQTFVFTIRNASAVAANPTAICGIYFQARMERY